jgi:hypothetical protein
MKAIQFFRRLAGLDPHLSEKRTYELLLKKMAAQARKGRAVVLKGGYKTLEEAMFDPDNHVFIVVVEGNKFRKPKALREWFKDYKI